MIRIPIDLGAAAYEVLIGAGLLTSIGQEAGRLFPERKACAVVSDSTVAPLHADKVMESLKTQGFQPILIVVPAGEPSKCFAQLEQIVREMIRAGLDRKAFLIALGGGVIGDLAGFAAAIHFRGIPYLQVPTTVLAQVDSSVGGKTGINTAEGKNLIGAFHQPKLVLADVDTLGTLPRRAWNEGFAEIIKHAAIQDATMLPLIREVAVGKGKLSELIARNVAIKGRIVAADEFETKGLRALLNFGHTIGHAIESCAGYGELLHGEAIALGMKAALHLSCKHTGLTSAAAGEINDLIAMFHLPTHLPATMTDAAILEKLSRDKKFEQGQIRFVLLDSIGSAHLSDVVTRQDLHEAIDHLR